MCQVQVNLFWLLPRVKFCEQSYEESLFVMRIHVGTPRNVCPRTTVNHALSTHVQPPKHVAYHYLRANARKQPHPPEDVRYRYYLRWFFKAQCALVAAYACLTHDSLWCMAKECWQAL